MRNVVYLSDGVTEVANIVQGSFRWKTQVNTGNALRYGAFCVSTIEFDVYGEQGTAIASGDTLIYKWDDGNGNLTDKGTYVAEPIISGRRTYHVVATAGGTDINNDYSNRLQGIQGSFPMTLRQLADDVCSVAGLTLRAGTFPNSALNVDAFLAPSATCRQMLSWIAEIASSFVRFDYSTGEIYFADYAANTANTIGPTTSGTQVAYKQDGLEYANYIANRIRYVYVEPSIAVDIHGQAIYIPGTTDVAHGSYYIKKNPVLAAMANTSAVSNVAGNTLNRLNTVLKYRPATVQLFKSECPFDVGDIVTVTDIQGVTFAMPVMTMLFTDGGATLSAVGSEWYEDNTVSNAGDSIASNSADIAILTGNKLDKTAMNVVAVPKATYLSDTSVFPGTITVSKQGNVIELYAGFNSSQKPTNGTYPGALADGYRPKATYAIFPIFSGTSPYLQSGSIWLYSTGTIEFYGVPNGGFIHGTYICQ